MLNIIKDYVDNDGQFTGKTAIPQDTFLDVVNLILTTTWYTFKSQFYQQTHGVTMVGPTFSTTADTYSWLMNLLQYLLHYTLKGLGTIF